MSINPFRMTGFMAALLAIALPAMAGERATPRLASSRQQTIPTLTRISCVA